MPSNVYHRTAMAAAIAACFPGAALAAGVARVDFATGNVAAVASDGRSRPLAKGAEIEVGETVSTGQGRAQLRFVDGSYMSLQPQTEFKVEEFRFSGRDAPSDGIVMNLLKGGLRTITGLIGRTNRSGYRLKTEVATIGIRGTEFTVRYTNSIEVFCADGAVSVENQTGTHVVHGGTGVIVSSQDTPPRQTDEKPVLPPESPAQQEQERAQQQVADPVNPIQEATPTVPVLLTGSFKGNWAVSYPNGSLVSNAVGHNFDSPVILDGSGALISYDGAGSTRTVGSATSIRQGNDGVIAWGRWVDGVTGGDLSAKNLSNPLDGPLHWVVGQPATNIPVSGTATYSMLGATTPSFNGWVGSASVVSSTLSVNFATSNATFFGQFMVDGSAVSTSSSGVPVAVSGALLGGSGSLSGPFSSQTIGLQGFLAGEGAARAGMAYHIGLSNVSGTGNVHGGIAYTK